MNNQIGDTERDFYTGVKCLNTIIDLDVIETLPAEIVTRIKSQSLSVYEELQAQSRYDNTAHRFALPYPTPQFDNLRQTIATYLSTQYIRGYHCTRELFPGKYRTEGLRAVDPKQHISDFIDYLSHHDEYHIYVDTFKPRLEEWIESEDDMSIRRNMIHLSLNINPIRRNECNEYFRYYGGEMLRWYLDEEDESDQVLYTVLSRVGNPVVVVVNVPVRDLQLFDADKLAGIFIYHYIRQHINDEFVKVSEAAPFLVRNILPSEIEHVYDADVFRKLIA